MGTNDIEAHAVLLPRLQHQHNSLVGARIGEASNPGPGAYGSHRIALRREGEEQHQAGLGMFGEDFKKSLMNMIQTLVQQAVQEAPSSLFGGQSKAQNVPASACCGEASTAPAHLRWSKNRRSHESPAMLPSRSGMRALQSQAALWGSPKFSFDDIAA